MKEVFPETGKARFTSKGGFCGQELCPVTHTFPGTIQRYIFTDTASPATVSIWLVWKDTEMPDKARRDKDLEAFRAELDDVLDWQTAQISTKEGVIYT